MDNLTPEQYQQLTDLGALNEEDAQKLALLLTQMKNTQGPESIGAPQMRQVGNRTIAPHWLEYVGALAQQGAARNKGRAQQAQSDALMQRQRERLQEQQAIILQGLQAGQQPQQWPDATEGMGMMNKSPIRFGG